MNVRDFNVDVKFANQGNIIYCIYDSKLQANKMKNALLVYHADTRTTEVLYEGNGVIATQNKFIVGVSKEVYFQLAQPVPLGKIRVRELDAARECFQGFPSFQQLKGIEERCGLLLHHFARQVIQPCADIKSESLRISSEILQQEWMSNRKKIEIIDEKVSDRANSGLLGAIRGKDGQRFQKLYSAFQLKKKADDIIDNVYAISLNMDEFIAPYAQQIIHNNQQTIKTMNEKIDQMAVEIRDLHAQNARLAAMVQTQQAQNNQFLAVVQQLVMLLPPAVQVDEVNFHPHYDDLQPVYEPAQSQVVNNVTMFAQDTKQRNQVKPSEAVSDCVNASDARNLFGHG